MSIIKNKHKKFIKNLRFVNSLISSYFSNKENKINIQNYIDFLIFIKYNNIEGNSYAFKIIKGCVFRCE